MRITTFLEELNQYESSFLEEIRFKQEMLELANTIGDTSFERSHTVPGHFTASAMIVNQQKMKVLLIYHAKYNIWVQPGGHIESNESVQEASQREATEETGLAVDFIDKGIFDIDIHTIPASSKEPQHLHHDIRYLFEADENQQLIETNETKGIRWVSFAEVKQLNADISLKRMVEKALSFSKS